MLKRVSIQNFKSLKDVTLDLQKVNLLIGPNNSGKTNFLKALEFCYNTDTIQEELPVLIPVDIIERYELEKQKFGNYVYKKDLKSLIKIDLLYEGDLLKYGYTISWNRNERYGKQRFNDDYNGLNSQDVFLFLRSHLQIGFIYKPDPIKLTEPSLIDNSSEKVNADASNLAGFLDLMLGKYRKSAFAQIEADIHTCIHEFDEIKIDNALPTEELKKQFGDKSYKRFGLANSKEGITYWADELSEGTLYFIALLCIINQPNPPKLLLLEEPEKGIHPRRIREVMDFIFRLAEEKDIQIILTSHNEHVLDDFATRPEAVFVFDKDEEGATYVRNLQKDIIEPTNQRNRELGLDDIDLTTNLSENWLYGLLGGVPSIP